MRDHQPLRAGCDEPSHVLLACGIEPELAQTAVRFTLGRTVPAVAPGALAAAVAASVAEVASA